MERRLSRLSVRVGGAYACPGFAWTSPSTFEVRMESH